MLVMSYNINKKRNCAKRYIHSEKGKLNRKKYNLIHKEEIKIYQKAYRQKNKEKFKEYRKVNKTRLYLGNKKWRDANPDRVQNHRLKSNYGITIEQKTEMFTSQKGRCDICYINLESIYKACVDHDHKTGKVRSLLCGHCNRGIGMFKENMELLKNAIRYLKQHNGN